MADAPARCREGGQVGKRVGREEKGTDFIFFLSLSFSSSLVTRLHGVREDAGKKCINFPGPGRSVPDVRGERNELRIP